MLAMVRSKFRLKLCKLNNIKQLSQFLETLYKDVLQRIVTADPAYMSPDKNSVYTIDMVYYHKPSTIFSNRVTKID